MIHEPAIQSCSSVLGQNPYQNPFIISFLFPVGPIHPVTKYSPDMQRKITVPKGW